MFTLGAFLSGGSLHGSVVSKSFKPLPMVHSLGVEGIYRLELLEADQKVHRQMVSAEIFSAYEVGDEFDDHATVAEIRSRRVTRVAREQAETERAALRGAAQSEKEAAAARRTVALFLQQDHLPETEGF